MFSCKLKDLKSIIQTLLFSTLILLSTNLSAQDVKVYPTFDELQNDILDIQDDKIYIINFWATWCGPCVAELPYFEELGAELDTSKIEIILVSIDFGTNLERKVKPFIKKKGLKNRVVLLDDPKANDWIDQVDPSWSGAIPITLFIDSNHKEFYEKEYHSTDELRDALNNFKNNK